VQCLGIHRAVAESNRQWACQRPAPDARLLKVFLNWTTPENRQAILVDNPSWLYDFSDT
jgi:hypothetical protein